MQISIDDCPCIDCLILPCCKTRLIEAYKETKLLYNTSRNYGPLYTEDYYKNVIEADFYLTCLTRNISCKLLFDFMDRVLNKAPLYQDKLSLTVNILKHAYGIEL